jgi:hypothetical protein
LALYFYLKRATAGRLFYSLRGQNLVKGLVAQVTGLAMTHNGVPVDTVSSTWIAMWNGGTAPIPWSGVAPGAPPVLKVPDGTRILVAQLIGVSDVDEAIHLDKPTTSEAPLEFDYLEAGHGAVLQIIHTSPNWSSLTLEGKIVGSGAARMYRPFVNRNWPIYFFFGYMGLLLLFDALRSYLPSPYYTQSVSLGIILVAVAGLVVVMALSSRSTRQAGVPASLRKYWA